MSIEILLERKIDSFIKDYPEFKDEGINKKFLFFFIFHFLRYSNVTYEYMLDGLVDGTNDYGIDGIFVFSSGELIADDDNLREKITKEDKVKIYLIQVCRDSGFGETALLKIRNGVEEIFDLKVKIKGNKEYAQKTKLIRDIWAYCFHLGNVENIEIEIIYASLSTKEEINKKVGVIEKKIYDSLKIQGLKNVKITYIGIPTLYKLISEENYEKDLTFKEVTPYAERYNKKVAGYYGLVKVKDFLEFITDKNSNIEEKYFEGNVRDYYGDSKRVNQKIRETLDSPDRMNLWCFNNGVTILCENSIQRGRVIKLYNFHIVNGCQTAHVIYDCKEILKDDDTSELIVKVIQTKDTEVSNNIIDATNSQTQVQAALLHSNDLIQRSIEEHFLKNAILPLYYERRMNYYKRRSKPSNKIVSVMRLFQVCYSIFERKPSASRGRPAESFDRDYSLVFDVSFDYDAYLFSYILYMKIVNINREEMERAVEKDQILFIIRKYGILHIIRIALPLFIRSDVKINLKDKKNIFTKEKKKLFLLLKNEKLLNELYSNSVTVLRRAIQGLIKKNKEALLDYNIMKNDDLDKHIDGSLLKIFKTS